MSLIITICRRGSTTCFSTKIADHSCAYFNAPDDTLEEAQIARERHIAAKLYLSLRRISMCSI